MSLYVFKISFESSQAKARARVTARINKLVSAFDNSSQKLKSAQKSEQILMIFLQ